MDYLTRLVDSSFRERDDGNVVFFPWGAMGDAYLIESRERYRTVRSFCRRYLSVSVPAMAGIGIGVSVVALWMFGGTPAALGVALGVMAITVVAAGAYFAVRIGDHLEGLRPTDERLDLQGQLWMPSTFPELHARSLQVMGTTLVVLVVLLATLDDASPEAIGLAAGVIGLALVVIGRKMRS